MKEPLTIKFPHDFEPHIQETILQVKPYTMTSVERVYTIVKAVEYVVLNDIPGAFVECGVWRGGSMMAIALTLLRLGATDRELYLFDTFEGLPEPGQKDLTTFGQSAQGLWEQVRLEWQITHKPAPGIEDTDIRNWCYATVEDVQEAMDLTGYPSNRIHYVKGMVEDTIPEQSPDAIALLRLDTDWYNSSYHELVYLYPQLSPSGVLVVDDYGWWQGQRDAVDQYIMENRIPILLTRVDACCRMGVKIS